MCGITLILSLKSENIINHIVDSLLQLQNRGYDSCGIGYHFNQESNIVRCLKYATTETSDSLDELEKASKHIRSSCAIGHTRWATHGESTTINAHPHASFDEQFYIVHNGIIENFAELREFLGEKNIKCRSQTDTEVIVNLIAYHYAIQIINESTTSRDIHIQTAINTTCAMLEGTYALGIITHLAPDNIYVIRNGSPLVFGMNQDYLICSSEQYGFNRQVDSYITLENNVLYKMSSMALNRDADANADADAYQKINQYLHILCNGDIGNKTDIIRPKVIKQISSEVGSHDRKNITTTDYKDYTSREIFEQPMSIDRAINHGGRIANNRVKLGGLQELMELYPNRMDIDNVILLGCGTSMHSCMIGANYILNNCNFSVVAYYDASEFTERNIPPRGKTLVILCSQSGETRDLYEKLQTCRARRDCKLLGVINVVNSLIAKTVDFGVYLNAGREVGVASTKSFTSTVIVLSLISLYFSQYFNTIGESKRTAILQSLSCLSDDVSRMLSSQALKSQIESINQRIMEIDCNKSIYILGKGNHYAIAKEASLKIKELCYYHAEGFSGSALKHGPFALLDRNSIVILMITEKTERVMFNCFQEIAARKSNIFVLTDSLSIKNRVDEKSRERRDTYTNYFLANANDESCVLSIPIIESILLENADTNANISYYTEIKFAIALQYMSYDLSIKQGINPDKPRNLAKVVTVQ